MPTFSTQSLWSRIPSLRATVREKTFALLGDVTPELKASLRSDQPAERPVCTHRIPRKGTLTLAEVQVTSGGKNIALKGKASQSSTSNGGDAKRAIDGKTNGAFGSGTQTHSRENEDNPWWEVDLGSAQPIDSVTVWNRSEGNGQYAKRLEGFTVRVLDENRGEVFKKTETRHRPRAARSR